MPSWILVPCLVSLRTEFNELAPSRDKSSDGSIGDTAHASSSSDHNPDETGATPSEDADSTNEVHAIDVDVDLRKDDWTMAKAVQIIVLRHRSGEDDRLQNVIYNRQIWSRSWGWTAREYTGSNPHDHHAHFSSRYTTAQESDTRAWGLLEAEDPLAGLTKEEIAQATASKISADLNTKGTGLYDAFAERAQQGVMDVLWDGYHAAKEDAVYVAASAARQKEMRNARDIFAGIVTYALAPVATKLDDVSDSVDEIHGWTEPQGS